MTIIDDARDWQQAAQTVEDQKVALATAAAQHGNDQQAIAKLTQDLALDEQHIAELLKVEEENTASIMKLTTQLATLQSTVTYPDLEYGFWQVNTKPDAASGRGTATLTPTQDPKTPSLFSIVPDPPLPGDKDNYFNVYATQKKKPNAAVTNFLLKAQFDFPTDTDMKNAHCIELEARQVLRLVAPATLPLMAVPAFQLNFSGNMFRYFDHSRESMVPRQSNWVASGIPMPRQRTVAVVMEAHRDDKTLFYDAFTINGQRHAVNFQAPLYAKTYVNERLSVSLQLDSHYLGGAFKVIPSGVSLEVYF